jgi:ATP-dependent DNA helicase RecG
VRDVIPAPYDERSDPLVSHSLASLVGPLRYACQRDFAQLSTVRDLRAVIERALAGATGVEPRALSLLRAALPHVDHPLLDKRKAALRRVVAALKMGGVALPAELEQVIAAGVPTWKSTEPVPASPAALVLTSAPPARPAASRTPPAVEKKAAAPKKRKRALGAEESRSEAKLLSIAPRSGFLSTPLKTLGKRLGPRLLAALDKKGLRRVGDILFLLPRCYEDRRQLRTIAELDPGERGVIVGVVKHAGYVSGRGGKRYFKAVVADRSGSIAATWFHAGPWLKARFTVGKQLVLSGEVRASVTGREMAHPEIEPAEDLEASSVHFNRIVPVYPGFERGDQRSFREIASRVSESYAHHLEEPLPESLRKRLGLMSLPEALRSIHFPSDGSDVGLLDTHRSPAHRRLAFDELFFLQLGMGLKRQGVKGEKGIAFDVSPEHLERARGALPFQAW